MSQKLQDNDVVIVSAVRTAVADYGGALKDVAATQMGVTVAKAALQRAGVDPALLGDVLIGNCMMRTDEINVARCISLTAGIPNHVPAATIQRQCSSSMQALAFARAQIQLGENDIVLVGGVESMSTVPYVLKDMRWGARMRHVEATDALWEGLTDPLHGIHMGVTAENIAAKYGISREDQDEVALLSNHRAAAARDSGRVADEIVPVLVPQRRGDPLPFDKDEHPRADASLAQLAKLKPVFKKDGGSVTAGNASGLNDGAAAAVIMSGARARELGVAPLARIVGHAVAAVDPLYMGMGPVPATKKVMERTGLTLAQMDLVELNEAFAAQYLGCERQLELDRTKTNVNGSGIGLGHPVGATGLRLVVSLLHELRRRGGGMGLASLCVGGGMGMSTIIETL
jgi:acetyl-CoA C-acetyltransferase